MERMTEGARVPASAAETCVREERHGGCRVPKGLGQGVNSRIWSVEPGIAGVCVYIR